MLKPKEQEQNFDKTRQIVLDSTDSIEEPWIDNWEHEEFEEPENNDEQEEENLLLGILPQNFSTVNVFASAVALFICVIGVSGVIVSFSPQVCKLVEREVVK